MLGGYGKSGKRELSELTTFVSAPNTNYYVLEVSTMTSSENVKLESFLSDGALRRVGRRWVETYFDSSLGQDVVITRTEMENDVPKEYTTPFNVDKSTP